MRLVRCTAYTTYLYTTCNDRLLQTLLEGNSISFPQSKLYTTSYATHSVWHRHQVRGGISLHKHSFLNSANHYRISILSRQHMKSSTTNAVLFTKTPQLKSTASPHPAWRSIVIREVHNPFNKFFERRIIVVMRVNTRTYRHSQALNCRDKHHRFANDPSWMNSVNKQLTWLDEKHRALAAWAGHIAKDWVRVHCMARSGYIT